MDAETPEARPNYVAPMNVEQIQEVIPHRPPFLLVDRILEMVPGKGGRGLKNVTANEPYFAGHFPGKPIMPGVLQLESMAQVASVIMLVQAEERGKIPYFAGVDKVRFRRPVVPGDAFIVDVEIVWTRGTFGRVKAVGSVDGQVCIEAEMTYSLLPADADLTRRG